VTRDTHGESVTNATQKLAYRMWWRLSYQIVYARNKLSSMPSTWLETHTEKLWQMQLRSLPIECGGGYLIKLFMPETNYLSVRSPHKCNSIWFIFLSASKTCVRFPAGHCATSKEGRGFDSRWYHWKFSLTWSFPPHYSLGVNRREYQEYFLRVKAASA